MTETENPGKEAESNNVLFTVMQAADAIAQEHGFTEGETVKALTQRVNGKGHIQGRARVKAMCMAFAGYAMEEEAEYDAFDPEGELPDATQGIVNAFSEAGMHLIGRCAWVLVERGKATADSLDYYRNCTWYTYEGNDPPKLEWEG